MTCVRIPPTARWLTSITCIGFCGCIVLLSTNSDMHTLSCLQSMKVDELMKMVEHKTGIPTDEQRLIYGGKQLEEKKPLTDYSSLIRSLSQPLGATIFLVMRLNGGANRMLMDQPRKPDKRKIDPSVHSGDDVCMISFEEKGCVKMPCGHSIIPDMLMDYCWNEINSRKWEIRCCLCNHEWPIDVLERYGGASPEELQMLEEGLSLNYCEHTSTIQQCPGCKSYCERKHNDSNFCVECRVCTRKNGRMHYFCWCCLQPWKTSPSSNDCGNASCKNSILAQLRDAPLMVLNDIKIPSIRACPSCSTLIKHKQGCKQMTCKCKTEFCFICLRKKSPDGSWFCGGSYDKCTPAPIQDKL